MLELNQFQQCFGKRIAKPVSGAMAIYRNTVLSGTVDALHANYPVVAEMVGTEMFEAMAVDFASAVPPNNPILATYGELFADWIEEQAWAIELPYLSEVARIERLFIEALFSADEQPLTLAMLSDVAPSNWVNLHFKLHAAARFGWATCPAMSLWLGHQPEVLINMAPEWKAEGGLFIRPAQAVNACVLQAPAHFFLFAMRLGESVGTAATRTAKHYPQVNSGELFATLVNAGTFAASIPNPNT
jgi:hypothetical protein